jgi:hypothetical protein
MNMVLVCYGFLPIIQIFRINDLFALHINQKNENNNIKIIWIFQTMWFNLWYVMYLLATNDYICHFFLCHNQPFLLIFIMSIFSYRLKKKMTNSKMTNLPSINYKRHETQYLKMNRCERKFCSLSLNLIFSTLLLENTYICYKARIVNFQLFHYYSGRAAWCWREKNKANLAQFSWAFLPVTLV